MVGLGLKLEELLKQKGLENKSSGGKVNGFEAINRQEDSQKSDKLPDEKKTIDTKKEIADFANTSHPSPLEFQKRFKGLSLISYG